jgi:hypothetical protein
MRCDSPRGGLGGTWMVGGGFLLLVLYRRFDLVRILVWKEKTLSKNDNVDLARVDYWLRGVKSAIETLRTVAGPIHPGHAYWDTIADLENLREWLEQAKHAEDFVREFERRNDCQSG